MSESTPLKVAFIALGFPPDVGGTELYNVEYAKRLAEHHELKVVTWETETEGMAEADAALPFEVRRLPYRRENKRLVPDGVAEALTEWGSEVAFISRGSRMLPKVVAKVAENWPVVLSIHEFREKHRGRNMFQRWRVRRRYGIDRARVVTVNSQDTRQRMLDLGVPEERLVTVYPGCDTSKFRPDPELGEALRAEKGWGTRPVLLTVSRLAANKGHQHIIDALPGLLKHVPELLYVIVGKGPTREALEQQARELGVSDAVVFTGLVRDPKPYYQACDVFCMASSPQSEGANAGEGFGIAYVEAGACGKAVLASSSGGGAEIVVDGETGRVIDPRKANQVVSALLDLLENKQRREAMGQAALERVRRYDWNNGFKELQRALLRALGREERD